LQSYSVIFENFKKNELLAKELSEYGYGDEKMSYGKVLLDKANELYSINIQKKQEEITSSTNYQKMYAEVTQKYIAHRKRAKIIFKNEENILRNLRINGTSVRTKSEYTEDIKVFYGTLSNNEELKNKLAQVKVFPEEIEEQLTRINQVKSAYEDYLKDKGESQQSTKDKNKAFEELDKWVKDFYQIAKLTFEDRPQLLEVFGKFVRSKK
ncbi:MAG: hypothetical protein Q3983_10335, partial [Capnocytophaga sp.]|nr:hypothetical protein [Capnocytophaga sp.]